MNIKRFMFTAFLSWLLFLSLDFLAHASILRSFWAQELAALKSQKDLFRLIPAGYLSFLLLTMLVGWLSLNVFREKGSALKGLNFGAVFGGLYSLSLFFGWYSFLNLPPLFLLLMCAVYFVEIAGVDFCFGYLLFSEKLKKRAWSLVAVVFGIFFLGIIFQNV